MDVKTVSWCTRVMFCRPFKRRVEVTEKGRISVDIQNQTTLGWLRMSICALVLTHRVTGGLIIFHRVSR